MSDQEKTVEPFIGRLPEHDPPLPVQIVGTVDVREQGEASFSTGATTMSNGNESVPVLPADKGRVSATILNPPTPTGSGLTVWILSERGGSVGGGFPLVAGASVDLGHQAEVFALCPTASSATQATIYYMVERAR